MILVVGPNGSGKSQYAETLCRGSARKLYLATMIPDSEDGQARVRRHRAQRRGQGFKTLEIPVHIEELRLLESDVVLLEDVSNLLANHLFTGEGDEKLVFEKIRRLDKSCQKLVAVSISGLDEGDFEAETAAYIQALKRLNESLWQAADEVVQMSAGKPQYLKRTSS